MGRIMDLQRAIICRMSCSMLYTNVSLSYWSFSRFFHLNAYLNWNNLLLWYRVERARITHSARRALCRTTWSDTIEFPSISSLHLICSCKVIKLAPEGHVINERQNLCAITCMSSAHIHWTAGPERMNSQRQPRSSRASSHGSNTH